MPSAEAIFEGSSITAVLSSASLLIQAGFAVHRSRKHKRGSTSQSSLLPLARGGTLPEKAGPRHDRSCTRPGHGQQDTTTTAAAAAAVHNGGIDALIYRMRTLTSDEPILALFPFISSGLVAVAAMCVAYAAASVKAAATAQAQQPANDAAAAELDLTQFTLRGDTRNTTTDAVHLIVPFLLPSSDGAPAAPASALVLLRSAIMCVPLAAFHILVAVFVLADLPLTTTTVFALCVGALVVALVVVDMFMDRRRCESGDV